MRCKSSLSMKIIAPPEVYQGVSFVKSGKRPFGLLPLFYACVLNLHFNYSQLNRVKKF